MPEHVVYKIAKSQGSCRFFSRTALESHLAQVNGRLIRNEPEDQTDINIGRFKQKILPFCDSIRYTGTYSFITKSKEKLDEARIDYFREKLEKARMLLSHTDARSYAESLLIGENNVSSIINMLSGTDDLYVFRSYVIYEQFIPFDQFLRNLEPDSVYYMADATFLTIF